MKIFIYGDSNTWGYMPNLHGYSKNAVEKQYPPEQIWWNFLRADNDVYVDGLCGRAIANDSKWLAGRNAWKTLDMDFLGHEDSDLVIVQLGTNDCKSMYGNSANAIAKNLELLVKRIEENTGAEIIIMSPAKIVTGTIITDRYYIGAEEKSKRLDGLFAEVASRNGWEFVSCVDAEVGEDGEHLTERGHAQVAERAERTFKYLCLAKNIDRKRNDML